MRPRYSNRQTRLAEERFAAAIAERLGCEVELSTDPYRTIDARLLRGDSVFGYAELKVRQYRSDAFETYLIGATKLDALARLGQSEAVKALLAVRWRDVDGLCEVDADHGLEPQMGGRKDRGDAQDREPCYFIPITQFQTWDRPDPSNAMARYNEAMQSLRQAKTIAQVNARAKSLLNFVQELDESPVHYPLAHHIRNLAAYRRIMIGGS